MYAYLQILNGFDFGATHPTARPGSAAARHEPKTLGFHMLEPDPRPGGRTAGRLPAAVLSTWAAARIDQYGVRLRWRCYAMVNT